MMIISIAKPNYLVINNTCNHLKLAGPYNFLYVSFQSYITIRQNRFDTLGVHRGKQPVRVLCI